MQAFQLIFLQSMYYILLHTVEIFLFLQIIMLTFIYTAFCHALVKITVLVGKHKGPTLVSSNRSAA